MAVQAKAKQAAKPVAPTKAPNSVAGKAAAVAAKGLTKDGLPRQRAYRTYYGATTAGLMVRYPSYEAREEAVLNDNVKRLTAHQVRVRETNGEQALQPGAARAVTPVNPSIDRVVSKAQPESVSGLDGDHSRTESVPNNINTRALIEAQLMLDQAAQMLANMQHKLAGLTKG